MHDHERTGWAAKWLAAVRSAMRRHASKAVFLAIGLAVGVTWAGLSTDTSAPTSSASHPSSGGEHRHDDKTVWTCSMHPQIRKSEPGQCPICGMDLIPIGSHDDPGSAAKTNQVVLSPRAQALLKLRTTAVRRQPDAAAELHLLGRFEPDETTLKTITAWTSGRIDRLHVNVTGQRVRAGQVTATLYSPEVFAAHQDLIVAKRQVDKAQTSSEAARTAVQAALDAARERLGLLGIPKDEVARMETQDRPTRALAIRSPFTGTIIERIATEGSYVATGSPLYRIANLNSLWLQLDAYEHDLGRLARGQTVRITLEALPGQEFTGEVTFIEPTVDERLRTAKVRVQVDNRAQHLRPGMFAEATVKAGQANGQGTPLVIPATAPLFTGRRAIVYVETNSGERLVYEPRTVRLGPRLGDVYPVVAGLSEGDRVVSRGAFALDADLQIRGGASMMSSADDHEPSGWGGVISLSSAARRSLTAVASAYLAVQAALADDDLERANAAASALIEALQQVDMDNSEEAQAAWSRLAAALRGHGQHIAMTTSIEEARRGFEPLSQAFIQLLSRFGNPLQHEVFLAFCPMAAGSDGALWVQEGREIHNAYFGASMLDCGEVRSKVPPAGYLEAPPQPSASDRQAAQNPGHSH